MAEVGQVIENKGSLVVVSLDRHDACSKCRACVAGIDSKEMILEATNACGAKVGDMVNISLEQSNFLKAVFIMYTIPLIALLAGLGLGYVLLKTEVAALGIGFVFLAITFVLIRKNENHFKKSGYRPVADEIVKKSE